MVVIGMVVIATAGVVGFIAVFAGEQAAALCTILVGFVGMGVMQLKAIADAKAAKTAAVEAKQTTEATQIQTAVSQEHVRAAVKELSKTVVATDLDLAKAEQSGVLQGRQQARDELSGGQNTIKE